SDLAKNNFSGGGHLNASGGKFVGNIDNAISKLVTILPNFVKENKELFQ
ncbi:MAG: phosphoesterase RecJ-like protein, partial [Arenicella sp.]